MITLLIRIVYTTLITTLLFCCLYIPSHNFFKNEAKKELHVFVWGGFFDADAVAAFEKEANVRVHLHFFMSNEELLAKIKKTGHYDLVVSSDYAVKLLKEGGHIQPLKKEKLDFMHRITPYLLDHEFDPGNEYSIPYSWEAYGLAVDNNMIKTPVEPSFKAIFDLDPGAPHIVMTPDPVEAVVFASHYLYGPGQKLTKERAKEVRKLLRNQKKITTAYADYRAKYLIVTEHAPIALLKTSFLCQLVEEKPNISFSLPKEGIFTSIENIALSSTCKNEEEAYAFINYIYRPEVIAKNTLYCPLFPACQDAFGHNLPLDPIFYDVLNEIERRQDLFFFHYPLPPDEIREIWVYAKT